MEKLLYPLFSNGTEFMMWQGRNCERCIKAVWYNEKKDTYANYKCAIQKHIEMAAVGDGMGSKRDYDATQSLICPYIKTEKPKMAAKPNPLQMELQF